MSNLITLQVDGSPSQHGHPLVAEFLEQLDHLLGSLNGVDCLVGKTKSPALHYRIVAASHNSPLTFTLEPVARPRASASATHIRQTHSRFFTEISAISRNEPVSPDVDDGLLADFQGLVAGLGVDFSAAKIFNGKVSVNLDAAFKENVGRMLDEGYNSFGFEEGMLDQANIHGDRRTCWIYPRIGPKKIRCDFAPGTREEIRKSLGQYVRVEGVKYFRNNSPHPYKLKVKQLYSVEHNPDAGLSSLKGMAPHATGKVSSTEFIRSLRNEWR